MPGKRVQFDDETKMPSTADMLPGMNRSTRSPGLQGRGVVTLRGMKPPMYCRGSPGLSSMKSPRSSSSSLIRPLAHCAIVENGSPL